MIASGIVRRSPTKITNSHKILINPHNKPRTNTSPANQFVIFRLIFIAFHGPTFLSRIRYGAIDNLIAKMTQGTIRKIIPIMTIIPVSIYARKYFIALVKSMKISENFALASNTILSARFLYHNPIHTIARKVTILITALARDTLLPLSFPRHRRLLMICITR